MANFTVVCLRIFEMRWLLRETLAFASSGSTCYVLPRMMLQIEKQRLPKWVAFRRLRISLFLQRARSQPTMAFFEENRVVKLLLCHIVPAKMDNFTENSISNLKAIKRRLRAYALPHEVREAGHSRSAFYPQECYISASTVYILNVEVAICRRTIWITSHQLPGFTEADSDSPTKTLIRILHLILHTLHLTFSSLFTTHIINYL